MGKENDTPTFMGKELTVIRKSDGSEKLSMKKGDFDAILAEKGVTKEVRDTVNAAHNEIATESLAFLKDRLMKANKGLKEDDPKYTKHSLLVLGQGSGSMECDLTPHKVHNGKGIDGKAYTTHKYGCFSVQVNYALASELRKEGGELDKAAADFEKALK